jgi:hypothetical protein
MAQFVIDKSINNYRAALHEVFKIYNKAGFYVKEIRCDNEFKPLQGILQETYRISVNFANPQEHVPKNETIESSKKELEQHIIDWHSHNLHKQ